MGAMDTVVQHAKQALPAALALLLAGAAWGLGARHPVAPVAVCLGVLAIVALAAWRPAWWLFLLPALLPVLNFSPWTGWWLVDESDLLVLALAAGTYARWGLDARKWAPPEQGVPWPLWWLLLASLGLGVWRGLADAGALGALGAMLADAGEGLYADYDSAWNTLRVAKSLAWALLLAPLLRAPGLEADGLARPALLLTRGMVAGLVLVCGVVLWERLVYAGLFEFDLPYRTSAWFWEMHVGGGAIDAYLAMATPFAFWAVWSAPTPWRWVGANLVLWIAVYAVLTTYSRGVYLAVLLTLVFMAAIAFAYRIPPAGGRRWGRRGMAAALVAVGMQSVLVLGGGSFMADRLARSDTDLTGRVAHWQAGASLLDGARDIFLGLGLGRLPAHYNRQVPGGEFPGSAKWVAPSAGTAGYVALAGPASRDEFAGLFSLTQRVRLEDTGNYRVRVRASVDAPPAELAVVLCERHLLYHYQCQWQFLDVEAGLQASPGWIEMELEGDAFGQRGSLQRLRGGVLGLIPLQVGEVVVRLHDVELWSPQGRQVLDNTDFSQGMRHWLPLARGHYLPWHIDNLYLELLIERGVLGLAVLAALLAWAGWLLWQGLRRSDPQAWVLAGALFGMCGLGLLISVAEIPRLALLLLLLLFAASLIRPRNGRFPASNRW